MERLIKISAVVILSLILQTCRKASLPKLTTEDVSEITQTTATSGGNVTDNGGDDITERGICWSTDPNPTVSASKTSDGSGNGPFISSITGLTANTTYYVRAYATNSEGVGYGDEIPFQTKSIPVATLSTYELNAITSTSAASGGSITDDGGSEITVRGVCWNTSPNPTIENFFTTDGTGAGNFASTLINLLPETKYWVRAYATNIAGTAYANELSFTTLCAAPVVTTNAATDPGTATVVLNATINPNNSSTEVTFEYGLTTDYGSTAPATPSPVTGTSNVNVSATISGLTSNTTYHFRVKAVNCGGTSTGTDQTLHTNCIEISAPVIGAITQPTCSVGTGSVVLSGLPSTGQWTITRTPGGITTSQSGTSITISELPAGTYTFTVSDNSGCVSQASANVVINAPLESPGTPLVGAITQPTCTQVTGSVVLSGLPATGTWTLTRTPGGTTTTGTGASATVSMLLAGTYTFIVTNASGCVSAASGSVVINSQPPTPSAPVVGAITQPICPIATGSVALSGLPSTGTWTLTRIPGGTTTTGTGPTANVALLPAGATYTFTVTNASGCTSVASLNVVITALALPTATTGAVTDVTSTSATFTGSANGNGSPSVVTFEYGPTTSYGTEIPADQSPVTNGDIAVSRAVTNLSMHTLYHYRVKIVSCAGSVYGEDQEFTTPLPFTMNGLVAYYPFNGNANDESGNGNNGILLSGATITADKNGVANRACSVNPGFVQIADNPSLNLSSYTLSIWFKAEQVTTQFNCLIGKNYVISYGVGFDFGGSMDCPAPMGFGRPVRAYVANNGYFFNTSNITCGSDTWYHVAVTYNDATGDMNLYINGNLWENAILMPGTIGTSSDPLGIGKDGFYGDKFNGVVDEVSIFNRALTLDEVAQLFNYY